MAEAANNILQFSNQEQVSQQKQPENTWLRQKSEPALWYMRFRRYLDLGPKRSLRAAIAAEPSTQKATKAVEKQETKNYPSCQFQVLGDVHIKCGTGQNVLKRMIYNCKSCILSIYAK